MKQFSLDEYLKNPNRKVVTRDGRNVRIICTDKVDRDGKPIIALVDDADTKDETCCSYTPEGKSLYANENLFFKPIKHEGWVNLYCDDKGYYTGSNIYSTEQEARKIAKDSASSIVPVKIEWEE